jgi:hypothetical protein
MDGDRKIDKLLDRLEACNDTAGTWRRRDTAGHAEQVVPATLEVGAEPG